MDGARDDTLTLVRSAKAGDRSAWAELHRRFEPVLRRRIGPRIGPLLRAHMEDSDDVVQSLWREAFVDLKHFEPRGEGSFLNWMTQLAKNKLASKVEFYRADKRAGGAKASSSEAKSVLAALSARGIGPATSAGNREEQEHLRRALEKLPDDQRTILRMFWFERVRQSEIGKRLEIGEDAARKRLARAEAALLKELRRLSGKA
jgi:RNA polymerase sigma factor (sigma-70 family)